MRKYLLSFIGLIALFLVAMTLAFSPSNKVIQPQVDAANKTWAREGQYPRLNSQDVGSQLDNYTDKIMVSETIKDQTNPFKAGLSIGGYARYWHGYMVWLRPMMMVMSLSAIRQVYALVLIVLLAITFYLIGQKLDIFVMIGFALALMFQRLFAMFISMQYANVTIVMLVACIYLLAINNEKFSAWRPYLFFLIVGSVTNFIDLLTFPLLTFGIPLLFIFYRQQILNGNNSSFPKYLKMAVLGGISWLSGYALTWLSKWGIASLVLRRNIVKEALDEIIFRTQGVGRGAVVPPDRMQALRANLSFEFSKANVSFVLLALITASIFVIWELVHHRKIIISWQFIAIVVLTSLLPYVWYLVLANHSQIHFWFTFREQMISVFGLFTVLSLLIHNSRSTTALASNIPDKFRK